MNPCKKKTSNQDTSNIVLHEHQNQDTSNIVLHEHHNK
jgi:hypothetical protein